MSKKSLKVMKYGKSAELGMIWFIYQENSYYLVDITLPDRVVQVAVSSLQGAEDIVQEYRTEREREIKK